MLRNMFVPRPGVARPTRRGIEVVAFCLVATLFTSICMGAVVPIAPPASVLPGAITSNADVFLFVESQQVLASDVTVDISGPGVYTFGQPGTPGVIPAGTHVVSYFFHRETVSNAFASIPFLAVSPTKILGIIWSDASLDATDAILGNPGTSYPTGLAYRGLELDFPITPDTLVWANNNIVLGGILATMQVVDQFRVIAIIPEPASCTMLAMAAGILAFAGWKRRRKA